ncbi:hypothetical protein TNCV_4150701 [Trichonephila clavipes]|nr:hypothetical protein TNCV_4150701 [Trichonephila clavipes]
MKELQTHSASKKTHIRKKNLVTTGPVDAKLRRRCEGSVRLPLSMMPPQTRNHATSIPVPFNGVRGMIAASPLSDEYAMRIATQTVSALICKGVLVPIHCLSNFGVPGTTENAFSMVSR